MSRGESDVPELCRNLDSGSGGYLEFVLKYAAMQLFDLDIDTSDTTGLVKVKTIRTQDYKEYTLEVHNTYLYLHTLLNPNLCLERRPGTPSICKRLRVPEHSKSGAQV
jgi:hypothetical protein